MRKLLISAILATSTLSAFAQTPDEFAKRIEALNNQVLAEKLGRGPSTEANTQGTCAVATPPTTPKSPNYKLDYTDFYGSGSIIIWREPCASGTGTAVALQGTIKSGTPFFCSSLVDLVQGGTQLTSFLFNPSTCTKLVAPVTVLLTSTLNAFNHDQGFSLYYSPISGTQVSVVVPPAGGTSPSVAGTVGGLSSYSVSCTNVTTGKVKKFKSSSTGSWNCNGLPMVSGDSVKTLITGAVK
jgi:hypothetical protein